jgi:hypothetical protein
MIKRLLKPPMFGLVIASLWTANVHAQQFDLSALDCRSFLKVEKDRAKLIVAWFAGFYTEENQATIVDIPTLDHDYDQLTDFCTREPSFPLKSAAEGVFGH